jgi:hypothetical protein
MPFVNLNDRWNRSSITDIAILPQDYIYLGQKLSYNKTDYKNHNQYKQRLHEWIDYKLLLTASSVLSTPQLKQPRNKTLAGGVKWVLWPIH